MASEKQIQRMVEEQRKEKNSYFRTAHWSPIPEHERSTFMGLNYFSYDPAYRVHTRLHRYPDSEKVPMTTSQGTEKLFLRYGYFEFQLGEKLLRVHAYKSAHTHEHEHEEEESLFVPFRDATSGKETYGAARYLDIKEEPSDNYILDFNLAYNPYCAYSEDYVCPLPPRENWLDAPISAGEKNYQISL